MAFKQIRTFKALGTVNTISIDKSGFGDALDEVEKKILYLDDLLSVFKPGSEISRLNQNAGKNFIHVSKDTLLILQCAKRFSELSDKSFSVTCGPLTMLWNKAKSSGISPSGEDLEHALLLVNDDDLIISGDTAFLRRQGQAIDLGGIAKGYAADTAADILHRHGVKNAVINFGGTVKCLGAPVTVGIQHPRKTLGTSMGKLVICSQSIVTSGDYERYFMLAGKCCHHIIDPGSGKSTESGLCSVTVIGDNAMELDALSTAIFVLGAEKGIALTQGLNAEIIMVTSDLNIFCSAGLKDKFTLSV